MPEILKEWLQTLKTGHVIQYRGKSLKKINAAWRNMRKDAGLDENVIPYSVRHTVATELRARGVPELEIAGLLGHNMPNFRSTGRYAKYNPEYLGLAVKAINEVLKEIGRATTRPV